METVCKFCGQTAVLQKSHIVPEFFYTYDELHRALSVFGSGARPQLEQKGVREPLLCFACEQYFNDKFEKPMKRIWLDVPRLPEYFTPGGEYEITGLDYAVVKLFHLSVLWRAHSITPSEGGVDLGPHGERIRKMLLNRDAGPPMLYPILAEALYLPKTYEPARGVVMLPRRSRIRGQTVYLAVFGGCAWHYVVSSHCLPPEVKRNALTADGGIIALVSSLRSVTEIDHAFAQYERNARENEWPDPWQTRRRKKGV